MTAMARRPWADLTTREYAPLALAALALSNAEIGQRLGLPVRQVRFRMGEAYRRLGLPNTSGRRAVAATLLLGELRRMAGEGES
jgi:DNA-binding CsgD family transcriptional regulator